MMFRVSVFFAIAAALFVELDACNGSNHYDVGHDCAFQQSQGTCQLNTCGNLVCVPN
ncbi:hypothetical protein BDZ89DRAFT_1057926 [Hymenopellis radicata]|nr:hypothetical protein BDZ89DRAFT_1057926 [Hymenopellis radicata]